MAPKFIDAERNAIARAINAGGLTAPQATELARQGELAGLAPFEMADSTARDIAAQARREAPDRAMAERAQAQDRLYEDAIALLRGQFDRLVAATEGRDISPQELTRLGKIIRAARSLAEGYHAQHLRQTAPAIESSPGAVATGERSEDVERMLAAMDEPDRGV
jgi:hypothetical protein